MPFSRFAIDQIVKLIFLDISLFVDCAKNSGDFIEIVLVGDFRGAVLVEGEWARSIGRGVDVDGLEVGKRTRVGACGYLETGSIEEIGVGQVVKAKSDELGIFFLFLILNYF